MPDDIFEPDYVTDFFKLFERPEIREFIMGFAGIDPCKKGLTAEDVQSLIDAIQHNNLRSLQGGNATERYHLTAAQVSKLNNAATSGDIIKNHNSLQNLQGGNSNERYHLTNDQLQKVISGGINGADGKSAYELAVQNGYSGTLTQWLNSLKGEKGDTGATGPQGPQGPAGSVGTVVHNNTTGLQGGASGQYYHLSQAQYDSLTATSGILGLGPESWTFTLENGTTVTKKVTLWP